MLAAAVLAAVSPVTFAYNADKPLQYIEDYEKYESADELYGTYSVQESYSRTQISVEQSDEIHGKSLKLGLTADGDNTQIFYNVPDGIKSGRIEMKFSLNITEKLCGHIYCTDSETGDLFSLLYLDGSLIRVGTNMDVPPDWWGGGVKLCEYITNSWYDFEIVLDVDNDCYSVKCIAPDKEEYTVFYRGVKRLFKDMGTNDYGEIEGFGKLAFQVWSHCDGRMYVDDVSVKELPFNVLRAETSREGNMFRADDDKKFDLTVKNCFGEKMDADVTYSAVTDRGIELFKESEKLSLDGGAEYAKNIEFDMDVFDTAMLNITFDDGINEPYTESFPFSCIVKNENGQMNDFFGICAQDTRDGTDEMPGMVEMYADYGVSYVRESFEWQQIEKDGILSLPEYYKTFIKNLTSKGIKILPILAFGNTAYDDGGMPYTKEGVAAFVRYAEFLYDELSPYGIDTFEVWNEGDLKGTGFNPTYRTAEEYGELLKTVSKALKAKNPNVKIIGGAISSTNDQEWLKGAFANGGYEAMDILQLHPYKDKSPEESDLIETIEKIKNLMRQFGPEKPIWLTELGWTNVERIGVDSDIQAHTKYEQAAYLVRSQVLLQANASVDKLIWYVLKNPLSNQSFKEAEFGIIDSDKGAIVPNAAKPAMLAASNMNKQLGALTFDKLYRPDDETYIAGYKGKTSNTYVAYRLKGKESIGIKSDKTFDVYDIYGNSLGVVSPHNGVVNVMLSEEPCYLISQEREIETAECTVAMDNISAEAVRDDVISYNISAPGAAGLRVEPEPGRGGSAENINVIGEAASFDIKTAKDTEAEKINVNTKVYDGDKLIYTAVSSIELNPAQLGVVVKAEPYSNSNLNRWNLVLDITNKAFSKKISGTAELNAPAAMAVQGMTAKIPELNGGESVTVKIPLPEIVKKSIENCIVTIHDNEGCDTVVSQMLSFYLAAYTKNAPELDGSITSNEWQGTWITLGSDSYQSDTSNTARGAYTGARDLQAKINLMWDEENLYLCADVYDNKHIQPFTGEDISNGDSFVFAVDDKNATSTTQFTETGCALTEHGTELFRWRSMAKNNDVNEGSSAFVKRHDNNHTIYEISIPWAGLVSQPEKIVEQASIGLAMMINDCDAKTRKGWLEFTRGISGYKEAAMFGEVMLGKP